MKVIEDPEVDEQLFYAVYDVVVRYMDGYKELNEFMAALATNEVLRKIDDTGYKICSMS